MDSIDEGIIRCVTVNARSTYAEIGEAVGLSPSAAKRRLDRLVADGVIAGFTALVNTEALGWTAEAYVEVYCTGNPTPAVLRRDLERIPEVIEACTVSGPADALLYMRAADIPHLERAIQRLRESRVIDRTESVIVLSRLINRPRST
ncbi:Lrp/AsnC family transcriptional regulator [Kutzneria sp. NPDC051319]|uniref:Lrp/AsnC family transcriptional regulator n=1 Tax=Kutzneria sp. NPDC051319 TaxID=3155047 RepID=UPI00342BEB10